MTREEKLFAAVFSVLSLSAAFVGGKNIETEDCFDVVCDHPAYVFDQSNILDDILGSKSCDECKQHGFSVCLRPSNTLIDLQTTNISNETETPDHDHPSSYSVCKHFVPADCEKNIHISSSSNSSKVVQQLCYNDVVNPLPALEVRDDNGTIFIDVESFWKTAYWKPFDITNFTLHFNYNVEKPELCHPGTAVDNNGTINCKWQKIIKVSSEEDAKLDAVTIPRSTIASEGFVTFWYNVTLKRPRQMKMMRDTESFVNLTRELESPHFDFDLAAEDDLNSPVALDRVPVAKGHDHEAGAGEQPDNQEKTASFKKEVAHEINQSSTTEPHEQQNQENNSTTPTSQTTDPTTTISHKHGDTETTEASSIPSTTTSHEQQGNGTSAREHYELSTTSFFEDDEIFSRAENDALTTLKMIIIILLLTVIIALILILTYHWRMRLCPCLPGRYKYSPANNSGTGYRYHVANEELANSISLSGFNRPLLLDDALPEMQEYRDLLAMCPMFLPIKLELKNGVGEGRFGIVYKGSLLTKDLHAEETTVHCAKSPFRMRIEDARTFLETLTPTAKVGSHSNVVSLMGICDQDERLLICMEPLTHADLQTVLREGRTIKGDMSSPSAQTYHQTASLMSMQRLLRLMLDCALGTTHLASRSVLHPHLAACNVLVGERGTAKISGFGFATHRNLYSREHEPRLSSIRWQAPETLAGDEYGIHSQTSKSQVWSLGVMLWEICSLGGTPYADIESSVQFLIGMQTDSIKLHKPTYVSDELYTILQRCFNYDDALRPSSESVANDLRAISSSPNPHINLILNAGHTFEYLPIKTHLEHVTQFHSDQEAH